MSKAYTEADFSNILDADMTWRRKELSDLKAAIRGADEHAKRALLRAITAMSYAHWEGHVRVCATRYFEHLTLRKKRFEEFERQIYVNSFLERLHALHNCLGSLNERCKLINDILDGGSETFSQVNPDLINTRSNLSTDVIKDICLICGVKSEGFEENRTFLDVVLLKRRNNIAHGQQEFITEDEIDDLVTKTLALMTLFRTLLENKVYLQAYAAS
jgi:hypothetical protein